MDWKTVLGFTILFHALIYALRREWVLRVDTRRFNGPINSIGTQPIRKYLRVWFRVGTYATIVCGFPFTLFLFLRTIYYAVVPSIVSVFVGVARATVNTVVMVGSTTTTTTETPPLVPELHEEIENAGPYPDADLGQVNDSVDSNSNYLAIQPLLPGVNLPLSHLPYYLLAILVSVVIHELGHAIASASHKVPIQGVGMSLFGPLIPAAHVELNSAQLRESPVRKQLDILTAGVWMNIYLALVTYFIIPKLLPMLLFPVFGMGAGLTVTGVDGRSGVAGPGGLSSGDVIVGIENCKVTDLDSWLTCLEVIWSSDPVGYCVHDHILEKYGNNSEGCCDSGSDDSVTHLCFLQMDHERKRRALASSPLKNLLIDKAVPPQPPPKVQNASDSHKDQNQNETHHHQEDTGKEKEKLEDSESSNKAVAASEHKDKELPHPHHEEQNPNGTFCLPAHLVVGDVSTPTPIPYSEGDLYLGHEGRCASPSYKCKNENDEEELESHCFLPRLVRELKRFRIVQIHRRNNPEAPVLFIGNLLDLYEGIRHSDFVPRRWWFPTHFLGYSGLSKFPEKLETILLLTAGLSAGLAVVNMLPIYGLDGYHIVEAMARSYFGGGGKSSWEPRKITKCVQLISWGAMGIALLTVTSSFLQMV